MDKFERRRKVLRFYKQYGKDPNGDSVSLETEDLDTVEWIQEFINITCHSSQKTTEVERRLRSSIKPEDQLQLRILNETARSEGITETFTCVDWRGRKGE